MDGNDRKRSEHQSGTRGVRYETPADGKSQVQEQRPANAKKRERVAGPGAAEVPSERRRRALAGERSRTGTRPSEGVIDGDEPPRDTATPGGALGTASYEELTEDPEAESSASDDRMETDER